MKNYIAHIKTKPPHERRQHAMQISAGIVTVVFVAWISTIGLRFATAPAPTAGTSANQLANIVSGTGQQNATLIIATTSDSNY